jgi:hypothetical protein
MAEDVAIYTLFKTRCLTSTTVRYIPLYCGTER